MDELVRTRPAHEPKVGPAGPHHVEPPPDFDVARRRLGRSARDAANRLADRLDEAIETNGLGRTELQSAQRRIGRLRRAGLLPSPNDYWESTAVPRAEILLVAATDAVTEEADRLAEAVDVFLVSSSRSTLEPWISSAEGRASILRSGTAAVERFLAALPSPDPIDELGEWWQRQLHRRAVARALPRILIGRTATDHAIGDAELELLDSAPWCYGDRLLSAFELANAEIRARAVERTDQLLHAVANRGHGGLVEASDGGPAIIKLCG